MKTAARLCGGLVVLATLTACDGEKSSSPSMPISPTQPSRASISLYGFVTDFTGVCIEGAAVEVVRGQAQGQRTTQETPCGVWDVGGGFVFTDLTPGVEMTLRASAPGWSTVEETFVPSGSGSGRYRIELKKL